MDEEEGVNSTYPADGLTACTTTPAHDNSKRTLSVNGNVLYTEAVQSPTPEILEVGPHAVSLEEIQALNSISNTHTVHDSSTSLSCAKDYMLGTISNSLSRLSATAYSPRKRKTPLYDNDGLTDSFDYGEGCQMDAVGMSSRDYLEVGLENNDKKNGRKISNFGHHDEKDTLLENDQDTRCKVNAEKKKTPKICRGRVKLKPIHYSMSQSIVDAQAEETRRIVRIGERQHRARQYTHATAQALKRESLSDSSQKRVHNRTVSTCFEVENENVALNVRQGHSQSGTQPPCIDLLDTDSDSEPVMTAVRQKTIIEINDDYDDDYIRFNETELAHELADLTRQEGVNTHLDDTLNVPDANGRVLVNVGHNPSEEDIFLLPALARKAKPHQIGGLRFMYDVIVDSKESFGDGRLNTGYGCVLAHSMGMGKSFQIVAFVYTLLYHTPATRVLLLSPVNVLSNWNSEFNKWLPTSNRVKIYRIDERTKEYFDRVKIIKDWYHQGGVLLVGYEMFKLLVQGDVPKDKIIKKWLLDPGADLVVCDEGHRIKNSESHMSAVLQRLRTIRRIVLTGYPLQNNMAEYYVMINFVRPGLLGTKAQFNTMFDSPIRNGQCDDSTEADIRLMKFRLHILQLKLKGFVQRREDLVLQNELPKKHEFVLNIRMSPVQRKLYGIASELFENASAFSKQSICAKIWNHPDILYKEWVEKAGNRGVRSNSPMHTLQPDAVEQSQNASNFVMPSFGQNVVVTSTAKDVSNTPHPTHSPGSGSVQHPPVMSSATLSSISIEGSNSSLKSLAVSLPLVDGDVCRCYQSGARHQPQCLSVAVSPTLTPNMDVQRTTSSNACMHHSVVPPVQSMLQTYQHQTQPTLCEQRKSWPFTQQESTVEDHYSKLHRQPNWRSNVRQSPSTDIDLTNIDILHKPSKSQSYTPRTFCTQDYAQKTNAITSMSSRLPISRPKSAPIFASTYKSASRSNVPRAMSSSPTQASSSAYTPTITTPSLTWASRVFESADFEPGMVETGAKISAAIKIIDASVEIGDRVLVFSQSLGTLDVLESLLAARSVPTKKTKAPVDGTENPGRHWERDIDYFRLDGSTNATSRAKKIAAFNNTTDVGIGSCAHVFLISIKAGGIGINLTTANRVIVLDVEWNPVHAAQAVCRVYRFGQNKPVFVYRMVASNTMEEVMYERVVLKRGLAVNVVDSQNVRVNISKGSVVGLFDPRPELQFDPSTVQAGNDHLLTSIFRNNPGLFAAPPRDHKNFLENVSADMAEVDRRRAKHDYFRERKMIAEVQSYTPVVHANVQRPVKVQARSTDDHQKEETNCIEL